MQLVNQHPLEIHCRQCNARFDVPIRQIRSSREMSCPVCAAVVALDTSDIRAQVRQVEKAMEDMRQQLSKGSAFQDSTSAGEDSEEKLPPDMPERKDRG
jgi:uncharacterized Zn finger protein (UPF0148 family)